MAAECKLAFRQVVDVIYWSSYFVIRFAVHPWMVYVAAVTVREPMAERVMMILLLVGLGNARRWHECWHSRQRLSLSLTTRL